MSTLVVGFDGSEGSRIALDEALRLAAGLGDTAIHLVFSYEAPRIGGELRDLDQVVHERADKVLQRGVHHAEAQQPGVPVTTAFVKADSAEGLVAEAERLDARYIVVGSTGEHLLKSLLVGATPTRLLHVSDRPVLVVRVPAED